MAQTLPKTVDAPKPPKHDGAAHRRPFLRTAAVLATAGVVVGLLAVAVYGDMPATHVLRALGGVLLTQVLPGAVVWRAVRPRDGSWFEDVAMGFAVGSVLAIGAQVAAGLTGRPWLAFSPLVVPVALLAIPATRARVRSVDARPAPWWWAPSVTGFALLMVFPLPAYFRRVPLEGPAGAITSDGDAYQHLALAGQLAHRGPTTFPYVRSEPLAYHWFSHAWVAQVSGASGTPLDETLFRFMPVLMPIVVALSVATAAVRLTGRHWSGPVAAGLALAGGDLNLFGMPAVAVPLTPLSPSLGLGVPMLVGAVTVLALRWQGTLRPAGVVLLPAFAVGAAGTKGSTLPLVVAGIGLALVAMLFLDRSRVARLTIDLVIVIGCLVVTFLVVFRASGGGLRLDPSDAAAQTPGAIWLGQPDTLARTALVLVLAAGMVLARGAAMAALPFSRCARRSPLTWFLTGAALAGAAAVTLFAHPGRSQWYFARSAIPVLAIGSALGLVALVDAIPRSRLLRVVAVAMLAGPALVWTGPVAAGPLVRGGSTRALAMVAIAGLVLVVAGLVGWLLATAPAERFRLAGVAMLLTVLAGGAIYTLAELPQRPPRGPEPAVALDAVRATSRGQIDAARWVRDHSDVNDLVMTNRHCTTPTDPINCDSRRFVVSAFSERQVLLEGWAYTPAAERGTDGREQAVPYWKPELLRLNDGFIARPTGEAARELQKLGVRWVFVDHTRPYAPSLEPFAQLRYQSPGVDVYEVPPAVRS